MLTTIGTQLIAICIATYQFSLGNSFWIHPLVQLSVYIFGAWYPVSFFVARPVREAYLNMAAVMISPVL